MNSKFIIFFFCAFHFLSSSIAQDKSQKIIDFLNQEIIINDTFSGQSITLIKENNDYFIMRKFFGSGVPIIGNLKYKVNFISDFQITFSEIVEENKVIKNKEEFLLSIEEKVLALYLNNLKIVIFKPSFLINE